MNLKDAHTENKPVQTSMLFSATEAKVISLQIASKEKLKEHLSKVPALLVCVSGNAVYRDEKQSVINLKSGDYVHIEANMKHSIDAIEESNFLLIK
jgi:quercetin dioxygenase-like cupin family protein